MFITSETLRDREANIYKAQEKSQKMLENMINSNTKQMQMQQETMARLDKDFRMNMQTTSSLIQTLKTQVEHLKNDIVSLKNDHQSIKNEIVNFKKLAFKNNETSNTDEQHTNEEDGFLLL
jgi:chromosome segregation ATPase